MPAAGVTMRALTLDTSVASKGIEKALSVNSSARGPLASKDLGPDQTLVRVRAAAVNPVDYKLAQIPFLNRFVYGASGRPGLDFSGHIEALGSNVASDQYHVNQAVFGRLDPGTNGTLAEYTIADVKGCVPLPDGVEFDQAAGIGTCGLTAYQCIEPFVQRDSGEAIFINGGSGGTGSFGIQIAKALGCYVVTSCSGRNADFVKSLGADEVIDYTKTNVVEALKKSGMQFSHIVDNVGGTDIYLACHHFTRPGATFAQVAGGFNFDTFLAVTKCMLLPSFLGGGRRGFRFIGVGNNPDQLVQLGQWMKEGRLKTVLDGAYSLEDAGKAFQQLKTGRTRGKIVVHVTD